MIRRCWGADCLYIPLLVVLVAAVVVLGYRQVVAMQLLPADQFFYAWLLQDPFAIGLLILGMALLTWQVSFALAYKPFARLPLGELPTLSIVIPAYNEGQQILATVRSVMGSDYPHHLLQVICVEDGSKDDTAQWMVVAKQEFPESVTLIFQPCNKGKREALMAGFAQATGEVVVTLDSDSEVLANTLAELVSPFRHDERVASVAGNVRVLNVHEGMIPKMLEVSFTSAFDFIRAGQSVYGGVFCTPGALSAYRTPVLLDLLEEWSQQTFMGKAATIGEDRALTNLVLAAGHRVVYQRNAVVMTKVPVRFSPLRRMLTRWARSNVRENLVMLTFVFKNFRRTDSGAGWVRLFGVMQLVRMTIFEALKCVLVIGLIVQPVLVLTSLLIGGLVSALVPSIVYALRYRSGFGFRWALPFAYYWLFLLSWIPLWGMFSARNSGWLTRNLAAPAITSYPANSDAVKAKPVAEKIPAAA